MRNPLITMRIRRQRPNNTFGIVRNENTKAHQGWDLSAAVGTPVYAITDGMIREIREKGDYGVQISLQFQHGGETLYAFYAHLSAVVCAEGELVRAGALLGYTGKTGNASGLPAADDHLHFEIRSQLHPAGGLGGRRDPGSVLGFGNLYASTP